MLADIEMFELVEEVVRKNGALERFENDCGKIKGRMMITMGTVPEGVEVKARGDNEPIAFEASFDFYDSVIGVAIYTAEQKLATDLWVRPQVEGADPPEEEWVEFFLKTLTEHIEEDGSFGIPIYSFINDTSDMTVVPVSQEEFGANSMPQ